MPPCPPNAAVFQRSSITAEPGQQGGGADEERLSVGEDAVYLPGAKANSILTPEGAQRSRVNTREAAPSLLTLVNPLSSSKQQKMEFFVSAPKKNQKTPQNQQRGPWRQAGESTFVPGIKVLKGIQTARNLSERLTGPINPRTFPEPQWYLRPAGGAAGGATVSQM